MRSVTAAASVSFNMTIVPIINVANKDELVARAQVISQIFQANPDAPKRVQIDVADGSFTHGYSNWREPADLALVPESKNWEIEIDALLENPLAQLRRWMGAGIKRFIFYVETVSNPDEIIELCRQNNIEPIVAFTPNTSPEKAAPYLAKVKSTQLLGVNPGLSGQEMEPSTPRIIEIVKENFPDLFVEIDGGVNLETAKECYSAGADAVASSSFIFSSEKPLEKFKQLHDIA